MTEFGDGTSITAAEYHAIQASKMTEKQLQNVITAAALRRGWLVYHTFISKGSAAGYPDLHLVHPVARTSIFAELKSQKGKTTDAQVAWLEALDAAGHTVAVWRPTDWFDGNVDAALNTDRPW